MDPNFTNCREFRFLDKIVKAVKNNDSDSFS